MAAVRLFEQAGRLYGFIGIRLDDYATAARPLSAKWDTLAMNVVRFRSLAADVAEFFGRASGIDTALDSPGDFEAELALVSSRG